MVRYRADKATGHHRAHENSLIVACGIAAMPQVRSIFLQVTAFDTFHHIIYSKKAPSISTGFAAPCS